MGITSYARNFEDVILWRALGDVSGGLYIDVGAQDPVADSVSKAFHERGWKGIHVEPREEFVQRLDKDRPEDRIVPVIVSNNPGPAVLYESSTEKGLATASPEIAALSRSRGHEVKERAVTAVTLDDVLELAADEAVHWLKIDVEGFEAPVLKGWRSACRPWVIVIAAAAQEEWESLILEKGYDAVYQDGLNRFYLHRSHGDRTSAFRYPPNVHDGFDVRSGGMTKGLRAELGNAVNIANALMKELTNTRQYAEGMRQDLDNHRKVSDALLSHLDAVKIEFEALQERVHNMDAPQNS